MINKDTICAISTAPGVGGIAVIRVSGDKSIEITDSLFLPSNSGKNLKDRKSYTLAYGQFSDKKGTIIDDVVISLFRNPNSFTGEDTTEISCHGSIFIQQQIIFALIEAGCRLATAGEFTQRAFLNGKMDLSQAEAVADLIASDSAATHRLAMNQMKGTFSNELMMLRAELLDLTALMELELDFSEEEVEFADRAHLRDISQRIETTISKLADSFSVGNAIKNGIPVAIIGETNAGKSTLLNAVLGEERAIVSDIRGTTRDIIEDTIVISGLTFRFIDTAGIRDTIDKIESLGIELAFRKLKQASIVLWMIDPLESVDSLRKSAAKIFDNISEQKVIAVINKSDKVDKNIIEDVLLQLDEIASSLGYELNGSHVKEFINVNESYTNVNLSKVNPNISNTDISASFENVNEKGKIDAIAISAKTGTGVSSLQKIILKAAAIPEIGSNDVIVTNVRHYEALKNALNAIRRVSDGLNQNLSGDFISQDIRECIFYLGEITGQISADDILGSIFGRFCIANQYV